MRLALAATVAAFGLTAAPARGQSLPTGQTGTVQPASTQANDAPVVLTLDEAIQIARVQNYALRNLKLDVENAEAQVKQAWSSVYPQANLTTTFTRNLVSANPFAGSSAGGLFQSLGYVDWLTYNEKARQNNEQTLSFFDFQQKQAEGLANAGVDLNSGGNPFGVANQFVNGVTVEQTLFNGTAFAAIRGAQALKDINARAADRQEQLLVSQVKQAFFQALLASSQADVAQQSVARTQQTVLEVSKQVAQGVAPKFQRLSEEVQLANLQTQLVQVQNQASLSLDNLKMVLGIPIEQPILVEGDLKAANTNEFLTVSVDDAMAQAIESRPDLEQARLAIQLRKIDKDMTRAQYLPTVSAFLNMNYVGSVPSDRTSFFADSANAFQYHTQSFSFFGDPYWNPSVSAGFRLSWNIFSGFNRSSQMQQKQIALTQAQNNAEQALQTVKLDVERALKNLQAARQRINSQEQNTARAELNYQYAQARLAEGVATQLEEREASEQLDQSRLNYLQAVYDYLVAKSAYDTAVGKPLPDVGSSSVRLTSNDL